jgi:pimeloyl-ACP methyl ester carboxylesterase
MTEHIMNGTIEISGHNIYLERYYNFEGGPTIVFLHDSLGCVTLWRDLPQKLGASTLCNVLVYDRLGYGKSDPMPTWERAVNYLEQEADFLNALLVQLDVNEVILFGHSDGGSISLIAAAKYPERIKAIICEAAHIFVEEVTIRGIKKAMEDYQKTNLALRLSKYHGDKVDKVFKAWTNTWTSVEFKEWNIEYLLKDINCPLLFIQGEDDEFGTILQVQRTLDQVRGKTEKQIISGIGHTPHKEAQQETFNTASNFIINLR